MASGIEYHALFIVFTDNLSIYRDDSSNKHFFQTTSKRAVNREMTENWTWMQTEWKKFIGFLSPKPKN